MEAEDKIRYLKSVLKETLELYYKEKNSPRGLFKKRTNPSHFEGRYALKDSSSIIKAELALSGMYSIRQGEWEHENGEVTIVKIDM